LRYDGSPKSSFMALKNLILILQEPNRRNSSSFTNKSLDFKLKGNTKNIKYTLMQKNNGTFYLIIWQEVPSFEHKTKTNIIVPGVPLKIILNTSIIQAATYLPVNSSASVNQYKNPKQLELKVPDHPLVIELIPG
jgi:hypothetical protein